MGERWQRRYRAAFFFFGIPIAVVSWFLGVLPNEGPDFTLLKIAIVGTMLVAALLFLAWPYIMGRHLSEYKPQSKERLKVGTRPHKHNRGPRRRH